MEDNTPRIDEERTLKSWIDRTSSSYLTAIRKQWYYGALLALNKRVNSKYELLLVVAAVLGGLTAPARSETAWPAIPYVTGEQLKAMAIVITSIAALAAAVLAGIKPALSYVKDIEKYTELFTAFSTLAYDLRGVINEIPGQQHFTPEMQLTVKRVEERLGDLGAKEDPTRQERLWRACLENTQRDLPQDPVWESVRDLADELSKAEDGGEPRPWARFGIAAFVIAGLAVALLIITTGTVDYVLQPLHALFR